MPEHIVLLGDSIFDNASYTSGEPDVITHLRSILPDGHTASLLAVDGSMTGDLIAQLARVPPSATRAVVSIGGNDALMNADILNLPVSSTHDALLLFDARVARFEQEYRAAIAAVTHRLSSAIVCTVYNGNLPSDQAAPARVALTMFNDVILRVAFERRLTVIDLRSVCDEACDYANPIEPSGEGGAKIARAIAVALGVVDDRRAPSRVFAD